MLTATVCRNPILRLCSSGTLFSRAPPWFPKAFPSRQSSSAVSQVVLESRVLGLTDRFVDVMRRYDVVNRGFSGWNTANAIKYLPEIITPPSDSGPQLKYLVSTFDSLSSSTANETSLAGASGCERCCAAHAHYDTACAVGRV